MTGSRSSVWMWLGVALLIVGLGGHTLAAQAIGGHYIAYRDHIFGFVILTIGAGLMLAGLGRLFWKRRPDVTVLVLGVIQTAFGLWVYVNRFNI